MRVYSEEAQIARECWPEEPMQDGFEACIVVKLRAAEVEKLAWCLGKMGAALTGWNEARLLQALLSVDVIGEQLDWLCGEMKEAG